MVGEAAVLTSEVQVVLIQLGLFVTRIRRELGDAVSELREPRVAAEATGGGRQISVLEFVVLGDALPAVVIIEAIEAAHVGALCIERRRIVVDAGASAVDAYPQSFERTVSELIADVQTGGQIVIGGTREVEVEHLIADTRAVADPRVVGDAAGAGRDRAG